MMTLMKEKQNSGRINAIVGLILGVLFVLGTAWMSTGNILWYFDMPSFILIALPIDGLVASLIAIVAIIAKLTDPSVLGPNLAVAILTLLYSLIFEVLLLPVAAKLWAIRTKKNC